MKALRTLAVAAGLSLASFGLVLAVSSDGEEVERKSWRPGDRIVTNENTPAQVVSWTHTIYNNGSRHMEAYAAFRFNISLIAGQDDGGIRLDTRMFVDGQYQDGAIEEVIGYRSAGDWYRYLFEADTVVPPHGQRHIEVILNMTPLLYERRTQWRVDYDPMQFIVETRTPTTELQFAVPGLALYGVGFAAAAAPLVRLRHPGKGEG